MKYLQLNTILRKESKKQTDIIQWEYYAYGFFSCKGKCELAKLPAQVKYAKCFDIKDNVYYVDGAL